MKPLEITSQEGFIITDFNALDLPHLAEEEIEMNIYRIRQKIGPLLGKGTKSFLFVADIVDGISIWEAYLDTRNKLLRKTNYVLAQDGFVWHTIDQAAHRKLIRDKGSSFHSGLIDTNSPGGMQKNVFCSRV